MTISRSYKQIKLELARQLNFSEFSVVLNGNYAADDADWNYKDVPHLNIVHSQVDSVQTWIADEAIATINFQKIWFITLPMVVFNYEAERLNQVYFTSFGPILLLVNTVTKGSNESCEVTTTYCLFAKKPFSWLFPILKRVIIRNNKILMSEDTPMRDRRGVLRRAGHDFVKPSKSYGYEFTTEINRNNVRIAGDKNSISVSMSDLINPSSEKLGDDVGVLSFKVKEVQGVSEVWVTTCPHEGAELNLTDKCLTNGFATCPWHGRRLGPLFKVVNGEVVTANKSLPYKIKRVGEKVEISYSGGN